MAKAKRRRKSNSPRVHHRRTRRRSNTGHRRRRNPGIMRVRHARRRRNPGAVGGIGSLVTNAAFVILGAVASKAGTQLVLGSNNAGIVGYAGNLAVGAVLWFVAEKFMHNREAAKGILSGTIVQVLLRAINDYTPFGSYTANLGMGDYQMQSFVTPQVLVDPMRNADIAIPSGWGMPALAPAAAAAPASKGVSGLYGGGSDANLY